MLLLWISDALMLHFEMRSAQLAGGGGAKIEVKYHTI